MIIAMDLDGPIRNFTAGFNQVYNQLAPEAIGGVPVDYVPTTYAFETDSHYIATIASRILSDPKLWAEAIMKSPVQPWAEELLSNLIVAAIDKQAVLCFLTSSGFTDDMRRACVEWIAKNMPEWIKGIPLVFARGQEKPFFADILIDDDPDIIDIAASQGKGVIAFAMPYNEGVDKRPDRKNIFRLGPSEIADAIAKM